MMGVALPDMHPCTWAADILRSEVCPKTTASAVICGAWALWTGRNACRHGRKAWEPGAAARFISTLLENLASLKQPTKTVVPWPKESWQKPEPGWFKVNTDASFDQAEYISGTGVVIRDHNGRVVAGVARWFADTLDVITAEAMAAKEGLELAVELGLERVILEVDCQGLTKFLQSTDPAASSVGGLCFDIIELGKSFVDFRISWTNREANSVAHFCASTVSAIDRSFFWIDCIPDWLVNLAATDCTLAMNE